MQITVEDTGDIARIRLKGKLDMTGAQAVSTPLAELAEKSQGLIVDLGGVSFLASIGIRQFVSAARTITRRGGRMVLLNPTKMVREVLTISAVNDLIPIVQDEKQAQSVIKAALGL
jgi:anti-sigma B factor antagonist